MSKKYVPISRYLATFIVIALIPVIVTAYLSLAQAKRIEAQALRQNQASAEKEFTAVLSKIEKRAAGVAKNLATWDETILNFTDSTYYQYWKENRLQNAGISDNSIAAVELYRADGNALATPNAIADSLIPDALERAVLIMKHGAPHLVYFAPVYFQGMSDLDSRPDGYLAVSANIEEAIAAQGVLSRSDHGAIEWKFAEGETVPLKDLLSRVALNAYESPEIAEFATLARGNFTEYILYSFALLVTFSILLAGALGRPLQRMAYHIRRMLDGSTNEIPESIQNTFKIAELEQVRQAVNDYRSKFHSAKDSLIEKNLELEQLTYRDVLTGVFNRRAFESHLTQALESARNEGAPHALCYMDLDQFKVVNDTCGHIAGDELLRQIAARLQLTLREADVLARLGGDEFGVLLSGCSMSKAEEIADGLRQAIKGLRFVWENKVFDIGVSIGLVAITGESSCLADVLKAADAACYMAKDLGRNRVHVYQHDDQDLAQRYGEMQWVSKITQALDENRFVLHCQPIVPLAEEDGDKFYCELLIRMLDDDGQVVPPMAFLPAAERYNLICSLDRWVVSAACEIVRDYRHLFETQASVIAINLSGQSLGDAGFLDFVIEQMAQAKVSPALFCFEVTETAAITHLVSAKRFIDVLRRKGCRFALDDFGSGLSSFAYLKNLPVDCLKIDGHFVKNMVDDAVDRAMVTSINQVGHLMGMQTVAEFVENDEIFSALRAIGVDFGQGYGIAKPMPLVTALERFGRKSDNLHSRALSGA
jgi:diguanylate cyclase (GGDEF)-like protein